MKLTHVACHIDYIVLQGSIDIEINKIEYDSREVTQGDVFVCITGFKTDGHIYALKAIQLGATAIICEREIENIPEGITVLKVSNSRKDLAVMASNFYDKPSQKLNLIGVTGTNGKTTTTYLIKSVLEKINHKVGIIGTIENRIGERVLHTDRTTPESLELQELFSEMNSENVDDAIMEVSSHSLDLHRVDMCDFKIGIFTNLTQDHLDYHKTMENYKKAKGILFEMCDKSVINTDDKVGQYMVGKSKGSVITYGIDDTLESAEADLKAKNIYMDSHGVNFNLVYKNNEYAVELNIPGKFSIYNALGAIGACIFMGIPIETIILGLKNNKGVKGRCETIANKRGFNAIVDYSHTPDSLENILKTVREFVEGRIITVFGCGGDRDKAKRPIMGEIAGRLSDYCIITSDNPRTENPNVILDEIEVGIIVTGCSYIKFADRHVAIFKAVEAAKKGDIIIIAGKGHEDYQVFADKTIHFDDVEVVKEAFGEDTLK